MISTMEGLSKGLIVRKGRILWNKPTFVGATILDLAKYHMYEFHYSVIKKMDTDSAPIQINLLSDIERYVDFGSDEDQGNDGT